MLRVRPPPWSLEGEELMYLHAHSARCSGCRACQVACSLHLFGENNPKKSALAIVPHFPAPGTFEVRTCTQCGVCADVCPTGAIQQNAHGAYVIHASQCDGCLACQSACPAGVDVPGFVSLVAEKRYAEALRLHRERNPFAAVCARVCFHTCEDKCRRAALDTAVSIRGVKRFMVDQEVTVQVPEVREDADRAGRKVAVVGAGPAGLSCAYFLARLGYRPTVFEAEIRPGGMLVQAIPAYRLPRETLAREIRMIERLYDQGWLRQNADTLTVDDEQSEVDA